MFGNTSKQLKLLGKEILSTFKALGDDIRQEIELGKKVAEYKKSLRSTEASSKPDATHAREDDKS